MIGADAGHFRSAFVETSFGAQGQTVDRVILGMSSASLGATNQEQMYVSSSRAKEKLSLYTDDKEAVKAAIQRSSQKLAALDLQPEPKPLRKRRHGDWLQEDRDRKHRLGWLKRGRTTATESPTPPPPPRKQAIAACGEVCDQPAGK